MFIDQFALAAGPIGVLKGSPLLLRLLDFNPFIPYFPTIISLLPNMLQFKLIVTINQLLDLMVSHFGFIDQFALRTLALITSQYTQILGLITALLLTLFSIPFLGLHRLILLPGTFINGAIDGLFAGLFDSSLLFAGAVKYWSSMIPRLFNLPLKVLTAPLAFAKGYLGSLFAQSPTNLFMLLIYPVLSAAKLIPFIINILPPLFIVLVSPVLILLFILARSSRS